MSVIPTGLPASTMSPHQSPSMDKRQNLADDAATATTDPPTPAPTNTDHKQAVLLGALATQHLAVVSAQQQASREQVPSSPLRMSPGTVFSQLQLINSNASTTSTEPNSPRSPSRSAQHSRRLSFGQSQSPEPQAFHMNSLQQDEVVVYTTADGKQPDFEVTLSTETTVSYRLHKHILRQHSEFFDGVLYDEPDRRSIQCQLHDCTFTSGDVKLYFDVMYGKVTLPELSTDKLTLATQVASYFDSVNMLNQCEVYLTNMVSPKTLKRTISASSGKAKQQSSTSARAVQADGYNSASIRSNTSLVNLALADRLHMADLKSVCIDDLTSNGFSAYKDEPEQLAETLSQLSHDTLTDVLKAVIDKKF